MSQYSDTNDYSNNINYSVPPIYPSEPMDELNFDVDSREVVLRISTLLFASPKPKLFLAALLFACGSDVGIYLSCDNNISAIALCLGVTKQTFSVLVKKMQDDFGMRGDTGKSPSTSEAYKKANKHKQRYT